MTPDERQIEIYRRMTPAQRLEIGMGLITTAREIKRGALRAQHPDWNESQIEGAVRDAFLYATT